MTFDRPGHTGHTGQTPEGRPQQHRQQPKQQRPTLNLAKEREFYRYLPRDHAAYQFAPSDEAAQRNFVAIPSTDHVLTSLAQLGAVKLRAERAIVSLFGPTHQYILAEATASGVAGPGKDDLRLGCCIVPRENGICKAIANLPLANPSETENPDIVAGGSALVMTSLENGGNGGVNKLLKAGFCAGVPIIGPRGNTIGSYCIFDTPPREAADEAEITFLKHMAATIMEYLDTRQLRYQNSQARKMISGLGSFVEGRTTLRDSWLETNEQDAVTAKSGRAVEGQLNKQQQDLQENPFQMPLRPRPPDLYASRSFSTENPPTDSDSDTKSPDGRETLDKQLDTGREDKQKARNVLSHDEVQEDNPRVAFEKVFGRAANLIRESIEVEGVVFVDARIESFGGLVGYEYRGGRAPRPGGETASSEDGTDSASTGSISSASGFPAANPQEGTTTCRILGYSTSQSSSINDDAKSGVKPGDGYAVRESVLKAMLNRYPYGKIFNNNKYGSLSDDSGSAATSASSSSTNSSKYKKRRRQNQRQDASELNKVLGGTCSIIFLPLWDSHKSRWLAGLLAWTNTPERVFSTENELAYVHAFGNSIMAEVHRLDVEMAERAKKNLATSISHELRSPLHGILGTSDILSDTALNALQQGMVHTIESCGRTLLDTMNHLLDFTYIDKFSKEHKPKHRKASHDNQASVSDRNMLGSSESVYEDIRLDAILEEVVDSVFAGHSFYQQRRLPARQLSNGDDSIIVLPSQQPTIIFDVQEAAEWTFSTQAGCWRRILMNVFSNALKYTPEGYIYIALKVEPPRRASHDSGGSTGQRSQYNVTLTVKDTGQGIGREYLRSDLFTPFSQEDTLAPGSGLGLSIVRKALAFLDGSIEVTSEKDKGTEVTIQAPLTLAAVPEGSDGSSHTASSLARTQAQGKTIGLIGFGQERASDRDAILCDSLTRLCQDWFHLTVKMVSPEIETTPCDFYLMVHTDQDQDALDIQRNQNLLSLDHPNKVSPLIVICQSPEAAHHMFVRTTGTNRRRDSIVDFISQPCGPRKLSKALHLCMQRMEGLETGTFKPEQMRWVEMPESLHLHLDIGPRDAPGDRMKISKRPSVESAGSQDSYTDRGLIRRDTAFSKSGIPISETASVLEDFDGVDGDERTAIERPSVLLVEDNPVNLQILIAYVGKEGWATETATNGLEAVQKYEANPGKFIMILIDISMPVMNGFEASRRIREFERQHYETYPSARPSWHPTIITALTGLDSADAQQEAFASGIDIFLTKPISRKLIRSLLDRCSVT
ncbi:hypothetical protein ASPVEDRAFT_85850 [Aspergillus versicolor CBS 583.65]|uniref:histidine kinase n=1 Tax=Aspergillus versicolor CBS 583.65 TaxID=1036611 RepID=A0A1L9PSE8_ASPVE|nr:uncharacterized protein ASPVEDRAFT_85850 [Aspergillus versicolor CBS 583.65]OJJ04458.1 hypothetical protein ASPVEDRAFT_85850 [Aspergillus versicolor CBS 583.65]